jgi:hypothetical protein
MRCFFLKNACNASPPKDKMACKKLSVLEHLQTVSTKYSLKTGFSTFAKYIGRHKKATTLIVSQISRLKHRK